ncbi:hypothetical protein [Lunatimonas lonarensis]|uniref:hypothetical protein n=1 Tax=Lunatimonas lonarensis TaxID=1232681 RepID=UPI00056D3684|nr:hypothetical protein [Lunatimonas lonarensis]
MRFYILLVCFCGLISDLNAQESSSRRSSLFLTYGPSGANVREFNEMLAEKGISPLRNGYSMIGLGYHTRINDFIFGAELYQGSGPKSLYGDYEIDYRTSRFYFNVGYALTEEGRVQFLHYMSMGVGYMNFQMLKEGRPSDLEAFLSDPRQGYILRKNNIHKGAHYFGGFLTEIGFQLGYDLDIPNMAEAISLVSKFGYSFSPFERAWNLNGIAFDNIQSGAFLRVGAGISLPDRNVFYGDATMSFHFFYGQNQVTTSGINETLEEQGYLPLPKVGGNLGIKVIGENARKMYGLEVWNLSSYGSATDDFAQTLNSIRFYTNFGRQLLKIRNLELGVLGGMGFGTIRYTLENRNKPDFPRLFEEPLYDGTLVSRGLMVKPEMVISYAMPLTSIKLFDLVYGVHAGYEYPLGQYNLGGLSMREFMQGPYLQFSLGIRP